MNTLKYINGWTKESVTKHVIENFKGKSIDDNLDHVPDNCRYRGPNNTKCIVGCFIPESSYYHSMEDTSYNRLILSYPNLATCMPFSADLMISWQTVHDCDLSTYQNLKYQLDTLLKFLD